MGHMVPVLEVAQPHLVESFKLFKGVGDTDILDAIQALTTSARIHMDNALCRAITQSVDVYRNQTTLDMKRLVNVDFTDRVVYTCPICYNYMVGNETLAKAKHVIVTKHAAMDDRVIVLELEDPTREAIVEYALRIVPAEELEENVSKELKLETQFFLKSKSGNDYKCTYPEK